MLFVRETPNGAEIIEHSARCAHEIELAPRNRSEAVQFLALALKDQRFIFCRDGRTETRTVEAAILTAEVISRQKPARQAAWQ